MSFKTKLVFFHYKPNILQNYFPIDILSRGYSSRKPIAPLWGHLFSVEPQNKFCPYVRTNSVTPQKPFCLTTRDSKLYSLFCTTR